MNSDKFQEYLAYTAIVVGASALALVILGLATGCATATSSLKGFNATSAAFAAADAATNIAEHTVDPENKDDLRVLIRIKEALLVASEYIISGYEYTNREDDELALSQFACAGQQLDKVLDGLYELGFPKTRLVTYTQNALKNALGDVTCSKN